MPRMYKKAGCFACHEGQMYSGGRSATSVTYYSRCECSKIKTKKYKKFLKKKKKMNHIEAMTAEMQFYDNYAHIIIGNNATDRSW